jgi:hypothetical protein
MQAYFWVLMTLQAPVANQAFPESDGNWSLEHFSGRLELLHLKPMKNFSC